MNPVQLKDYVALSTALEDVCRYAMMLLMAPPRDIALADLRTQLHDKLDRKLDKRLARLGLGLHPN